MLTLRGTDETDFFSKQVFFNRSWKLLVTGLTQAESLSRHVAILSLRKVIPVIKETLLDDSTRVVRTMGLKYYDMSDVLKDN